MHCKLICFNDVCEPFGPNMIWRTLRASPDVCKIAKHKTSDHPLRTHSHEDTNTHTAYHLRHAFPTQSPPPSPPPPPVTVTTLSLPPPPLNLNEFALRVLTSSWLRARIAWVGRAAMAPIPLPRFQRFRWYRRRCVPGSRATSVFYTSKMHNLGIQIIPLVSHFEFVKLFLVGTHLKPKFRFGTKYGATQQIHAIS